MAEYPKDWENVSVKSLMDLQCGFPFKSIFFNSKGNGIRLVKNRDLKADDQVYFTTEQVSDEYIIRDGDILIGMDGDFLPCRWKKGLALLNQRVGRLVATKHVDRVFAYYVLRAPLTELQQATSATTVKHLSPSAFGNLLITVPSEVAEQHRIADALASIDELIDNLARRIEKKRLVKQGVMQELLTGKKRLPGFKREWRQWHLSEVAVVEKGTQFDQSKLVEHAPYALVNGGAEPSGYSYEFNSEGETITISEGGNSCGFVNRYTEPIWCGGHCYRVTEREGFSKGFLFFNLKFNESRIMALRVGSGLPNVQRDRLNSFSLLVPDDLSEQEAIADVLGNMDAEIARLEAKREKVIDIKQGMMNDLLTGKVRI